MRSESANEREKERQTPHAKLFAVVIINNIVWKFEQLPNAKSLILTFLSDVCVCFLTSHGNVDDKRPFK